MFDATQRRLADPGLQGQVKASLRKYTKNEPAIDVAFWTAIAYVWSRSAAEQGTAGAIKDPHATVFLKARSILLDDRKKSRRFISLPDERFLAAIGVGDTKPDARTKLLHRMNDCVERLPIELRQIVKSYVWGKQSFEAIAKGRGVSRSTVQRRWDEAKQRLAALLLDRSGTDDRAVAALSTGLEGENGTDNP